MKKGTAIFPGCLFPFVYCVSGVDAYDLGAYLPPGVTELVSGGAKGIDTCAREYALSHGLKLTEFLPDYRLYGRAAPLVRNREIVAYAD